MAGCLNNEIRQWPEALLPLPVYSLIRIMHSLVSCHNDEILHPDRIIHLPMVLFSGLSGFRMTGHRFMESGGYQNRAVNKNCATHRPPRRRDTKPCSQQEPDTPPN